MNEEESVEINRPYKTLKSLRNGDFAKRGK